MIRNPKNFIQQVFVEFKTFKQLLVCMTSTGVFINNYKDIKRTIYNNESTQNLSDNRKTKKKINTTIFATEHGLEKIFTGKRTNKCCWIIDSGTPLNFTKEVKDQIEPVREFPHKRFFQNMVVRVTDKYFPFESNEFRNRAFHTVMVAQYDDATLPFLMFMHSQKELVQMHHLLLINCKLRRSQSSLHTARRCIPNVPTYISNDHEHQNGTINSSLVGVIIGDWKFYNHQGLCFNSKRSIRKKHTKKILINNMNLSIRDISVYIKMYDYLNIPTVPEGRGLKSRFARYLISKSI
ncbi:hypothetical protein H8356DRAFT_1335683 [Neocallimastix lanati (nom. inval.)]|nr:hypothetical protein H8356DRAFT_1335683 [Neocallimastix sp. JGI-2020a]